MPGREPIDELLDRAIAALNRGDVAGAHALADEVLAADAGNVDASQLRSTASAPTGELRRLTLMFSDLVGSTELSAVLEPEAYHDLLQRYQDSCRTVVEQGAGGSIISFRGDGILAAFGYPTAHEDDVDRAVLAGLELVAAVEELALRSTGSADRVAVRVAVHRGLVFLDRERGDLFGLAANVAARIEGLAGPGTVLVSDEVRALLGDRYDVESHPSRPVKGLAEPLTTHTVRGERLDGRRRAGSAPLIGRQDELAVLREAWAEAQEGRRRPGTCVAVTGDAGLGKSRLVAGLVHEVVADGGAVVEVAGSPRHAGSGLFPFRRTIELQAGLERDDDGPARLDKLRALLADRGLPADRLGLLATLLGIDRSAGYQPVELDARQLREEIDGAVIAYLDSWQRAAGSVLVVEDLHWFDDSSRELVGQLVRADSPGRLIVLSSRNLADVPRGDRTTHVGLAPLDDRSRLALVEALAGDQLDQLSIRDVAEQSDGVPLFAEELARAAVTGAGAGPAPGGAALDPAVPDSIYGALVARLNVAPEVLEVATTAAVIGRDVDLDLLVRATTIDPAGRDRAVDQLLTERLLVPSPDDPARLRFRHELLRSVVADLVPPKRLRSVHRAVADAMTAEGTDPDAVDWLVVATHHEAAGQAAASAAAFGKASELARQRGELVEARALLTRAIEVIERAGEVAPELEVDLRLRRGFLAVSLEGNSSVSTAADYERCLELSLATNHAGALLSTLGCLGSYFAARAEFDRSRELLGGLVRVEGPLHDFAEFFARAGHALCDIYCGEMSRGLELAEQALVMLEAFDSPADYAPWWFTPLDPSVITHTMVAIGHFSAGHVAASERRLEIGREAAARLPFPNGAFSLAGHLSLEVWLAAELGDDQLVGSAMRRIVDLSTRHGFDQWAIVAATAGQVWEGLKAARAGDGPAASQAAHALGGHLMMWKLVDQWVFLTYYLTMQGVLHAAGGEADLARAALEEAMELSARTGMAFYEVETRRHLAALIDEPQEREVALREALALARRQGNAIFELRVAHDLERLTGDLDPTRVALSRIDRDTRFDLVAQARALVGDG
jgi:class 3 adenylate cyclase